MVSATSVGNVITWATVSVSRSTRTSFGPPGSVGWNIGLPVSSTQSRSAGSTTTLCTDTNASASAFPLGLFHRWSTNPSSGAGMPTRRPGPRARMAS